MSIQIVEWSIAIVRKLRSGDLRRMKQASSRSVGRSIEKAGYELKSRGDSSAVARPDFKSVKGRKPVLGGSTLTFFRHSIRRRDNVRGYN
jgi:hypothetical protein